MFVKTSSNYYNLYVNYYNLYVERQPTDNTTTITQTIDNEIFKVFNITKFYQM